MAGRRYRDDDDYPENETSTQQWWDEKDRQMKADIAADRAYAQSLAGLEHRLSIIDSALVRENTPDLAKHEAEVVALRERIDAMRAEEQAAEDARQAIIDAEWTAEVTAERRAAWNARVRGGEFNLAGRVGKPAIDPRKVRAAENAQGWTLDDLKRAVERYKVQA